MVYARKMQIYPLTIDKTEEKSDCVKFTSIGSGYSCRPFWPWLRIFYMGAVVTKTALVC